MTDSNDKNILEGFETIIQSAVKSKSRIIAEMLPQIEIALAAGAKHDSILALLNNTGLKLSKKSYEVMLVRARAKLKKPRAKINTTSTPGSISPAANKVSLPVPAPSSGPVLPPERKDSGVTLTYDPEKDF
jgi:hypothetical protein